MLFLVFEVQTGPVREKPSRGDDFSTKRALFFHFAVLDVSYLICKRCSAEGARNFSLFMDEKAIFYKYYFMQLGIYKSSQ